MNARVRRCLVLCAALWLCTGTVLAAGGGTQTWDYDADGNLIQTTTPNGRTIDYAVDALNRTTSETVSSPQPGEISLSQYQHDGNGNVTQVKETVNGSVRTAARTYDPFDRLATATDVHGKALVYAYDANSAFHQQAVTFLTHPNFEYYVTTKNISEYFGVLSKMNEPFAKVWQFYQSIKANCGILCPNPVSLAIFEKLLQQYQPKGNRVYDLEIVSIALAHQITDIGTHNVKDFSTFVEVNAHPL